MNDFTKEELELISSGLEYWFERKYLPETENLLDKLQSMIDNYCITNGHSYEFSGGPGYCENCGKKE